MAKPYRRRKGKTGPYVGNFRVTVDGRDINLQTKDAQEAQARARLAVKGQWPVVEAAVAAAVQALDPGRHKDPEPTPLAGETLGTGGGAPHADEPPPVTHAPSPRETPSHGPSIPLNEAAAAAAAEVSGATSEKTDAQAEQESQVSTELAEIMAELGGGQGGADLLTGICDGAAAFLLWAEGKGIELGVNWALTRRQSTVRLKTKQPEQASLMRRSLRVGLKGMAVTWFPDFASHLTPGIAIAVGLIGGATMSVMEGELVDVKSGKHQVVGEAFVQAQEAAKQEPPPQPSPAAA